MKELILAFNALPTSLTATITILIFTLLLLILMRKSFDILAVKIDLERIKLRTFENLIRYFILIGAVLIILSVFGVSLGGVWTAISATIAMFAIGFVAMWGVLSNVLCIVLMLFTQPFYVGDEMEMVGDPVSGRVVNITLTHATLKTEDGFFFQIPGNLFFQKMFKRKAGNRKITLAHQLLIQEPID